MSEKAYVYFIRQSGENGPVKIGCSTMPRRRLSTLQTWSPYELEIAASFEGGLEVEMQLHEHFAQWQIKGEWFEPTARLNALIAAIKAGGRVEDIVDLSQRNGKFHRRPNTPSPEAKVVGSYKRRVDQVTRNARARGREIPNHSAVAAILKTAGGYRQNYRVLTQDEIQTLETFIAKCRAPKSRVSA